MCERRSARRSSLSGGELDFRSPRTSFRNEPADARVVATSVDCRPPQCTSGSGEVLLKSERGESRDGLPEVQIPKHSASFTYGKRGGRYARISGGIRALSCDVQVNWDVKEAATATEEPACVEVRARMGTGPSSLTARD